MIAATDRVEATLVRVSDSLLLISIEILEVCQDWTCVEEAEMPSRHTLKPSQAQTRAANRQHILAP